MPKIVIPLVLFALWAIALLAGILLWRGFMIMKKDVALNTIPHGQPHGSDAYWRLNRAHMNTLENLPIFAALVLAAMTVGNAELREPLTAAAWLVFFARVGQSVTHMISTSVIFVGIRFTFFITQVGAFTYMALSLLRIAGE